MELCAEVELTVAIGQRVKPDAGLGAPAEAIAGLAVALEIVDGTVRSSAVTSAIDIPLGEAVLQMEIHPALATR